MAESPLMVKSKTFALEIIRICNDIIVLNQQVGKTHNPANLSF